jgi:hypothetical protein
MVIWRRAQIARRALAINTKLSHRALRSVFQADELISLVDAYATIAQGVTSRRLGQRSQLRRLAHGCGLNVGQPRPAAKRLSVGFREVFEPATNRRAPGDRWTMWPIGYSAALIARSRDRSALIDR